jgi:hypothetical protein
VRPGSLIVVDEEFQLAQGAVKREWPDGLGEGE